MSDDISMPLAMKLLSYIVVALGGGAGGAGVQQYRFRHLDKQVEAQGVEIKDLREKIRTKTDCGDICANFQHTMERMTDKMEEGFERMRKETKEDFQIAFKKLDGKEDKH